MENKNYLGLAALVCAVLGLGLFLGSRFSPSKGASDVNVNVTNGGASSGGSSPSLLSNGKDGDDLKFGAVSGTQYSDIGTQSQASTTGSFRSNTTIAFDVVAGTMATGSNIGGTTSTISFPGRTCFFVTSPTGTRWAVTFANGTFNGAIGDCD